jgi:hypothetical protein
MREKRQETKVVLDNYKDSCKSIPIFTSNDGKFCLWESVRVNNGIVTSTIISDKTGTAKTHILTMDTQKQSLCILEVGDYIIRSFKELDFSVGISVFRVESFKTVDNINYADIKLILRKDASDNLEDVRSWKRWNPFIGGSLKSAINFSVSKLFDPQLIFAK